MKKIKLLWAIVFVLSTMTVQAQEILLSENWSSGTIDTHVWNLYSTTDATITNHAATSFIPASSGNALQLGPGANGAITSVATWPRGHNLRVTFTFMMNALTHGSMVQGPWRTTNAFGTAGNWTDCPGNIAAGFVGCVSWWGCSWNEDNAQGWAVNGSTDNYSGVGTDPAFNAAMIAAGSGPGPWVTVRVIVGDTAGATAEWSTDGVTFTQLTDSAGKVIDTRSSPAGTGITALGLAPDSNGASGFVTNGSSPLNIGFYNSPWGDETFIGSILVERDSATPVTVSAFNVE